MIHRVMHRRYGLRREETSSRSVCMLKRRMCNSSSAWKGIRTTIYIVILLNMSNNTVNWTHRVMNRRYRLRREETPLSNPQH